MTEKLIRSKRIQNFKRFASEMRLHFDFLFKKSIKIATFIKFILFCIVPGLIIVIYSLYSSNQSTITLRSELILTEVLTLYLIYLLFWGLTLGPFFFFVGKISKLAREEFENREFFILFTKPANKTCFYLTKILLINIIMIIFNLFNIITLSISIGLFFINSFETMLFFLTQGLILLIFTSSFQLLVILLVIFLNIYVPSENMQTISIILMFFFVLIFLIIRYLNNEDGNYQEEIVSYFDLIHLIVFMYYYFSAKLRFINPIYFSSQISFLFGIKDQQYYPNLIFFPNPSILLGKLIYSLFIFFILPIIMLYFTIKKLKSQKLEVEL